MKIFSQRKGLKPIKEIIQKDSMDDDLKNSLWNAFTIYYGQRIGSILDLSNDIELQTLAHRLWFYYFKKPIDEMSLNSIWFLKYLRDAFWAYSWDEVYSFLEEIVDCYPNQSLNEEFMDFCNEVLKKELSAYRFIGGQITEITSNEEIVSIEHALATAPSPVQIHLEQALNHFADRINPDYRNSIKESISAVESISKLITGDSKTTLGKALNQIESKKTVDLHTKLKEAFVSLYGYTSDSSGIRHALLDEPNLNAEDARFMLVSCSAFINYLTEKAQKAGIKL